MRIGAGDTLTWSHNVNVIPVIGERSFTQFRVGCGYGENFRISRGIPRSLGVVVTCCGDDYDIFIISILDGFVQELCIGIVAETKINDFCSMISRPDDPLGNRISCA
ncbi:hypothetical protein D3C81_932470 [compost metagenome]